MDDARLVKSVVLVIGTMGSGKSTLLLGLRALGAWLGTRALDTDECRAPVYEPRLKELRVNQAWKAHNELWYPMVWGGMMARIQFLMALGDSWPPFYVIDHGGGFLTELKQFKVLRGVIALDTSEETALDRVILRERRNKKSVLANENLVRLVSSNAAHIRSQVQWLSNHGVEVRTVSTDVLDPPEVLEAVLEHVSEWDPQVRIYLRKRGES